MSDKGRVKCSCTLVYLELLRYKLDAPSVCCGVFDCIVN